MHEGFVEVEDERFASPHVLGLRAQQAEACPRALPLAIVDVLAALSAPLILLVHLAVVLLYTERARMINDQTFI